MCAPLACSTVAQRLTLSETNPAVIHHQAE
jgi:hypothetical protein